MPLFSLVRALYLVDEYIVAPISTREPLPCPLDFASPHLCEGGGKRRLERWQFSEWVLELAVVFTQILAATFASWVQAGFINLWLFHNFMWIIL